MAGDEQDSAISHVSRIGPGKYREWLNRPERRVDAKHERHRVARIEKDVRLARARFLALRLFAQNQRIEVTLHRRMLPSLPGERNVAFDAPLITCTKIAHRGHPFGEVDNGVACEGNLRPLEGSPERPPTSSIAPRSDGVISKRAHRRP